MTRTCRLIIKHFELDTVLVLEKPERDSTLVIEGDSVILRFLNRLLFFFSVLKIRSSFPCKLTTPKFVVYLDKVFVTLTYVNCTVAMINIFSLKYLSVTVRPPEMSMDVINVELLYR